MLENGAICINWLIDNCLPFSSLCHLLPLESNLLLCLHLAGSDGRPGCWLMICWVWPYRPCTCTACPPRIWVCPGGAYCIRCKPRVPEQVGLMVWPCPPGRAWTMMGWLVVTNWPSLTCTINGCPWTCCCICPACTIICSVELLLFAVYCSMVPPSQSPVHSQFHPGDPRTLPDVPHASLPWLAAHADWFQYQTPKFNQRLQPLLPTPLPLLRKWQSFLPKSCGCGQNYMTYYI